MLINSYKKKHSPLAYTMFWETIVAYQTKIVVNGLFQSFFQKQIIF